MSTKQLLQNILKTDNPSAFANIASEYPYFEIAHIAKALHSSTKEDLANSTLLLNNPLWMQYLQVTANDVKEESVVKAEQVKSAAVNKIEAENIVLPSKSVTNIDAENDELNKLVAIDPYHTIDYFASQGIKITENAVTNDKLSVQLKSFTDWLKSMKKVDAKPLPEDTEMVDNQHSKVVVLAEGSLVKNEILTENMVDVLVMQGKTNEAITLLEKLSLQDTAKSSYFASRIEQLKSK